MPIRVSVVVLSSLLLSGCAMGSRYDRDAKETSVRLVEKRAAGSKLNGVNTDKQILLVGKTTSVLPTFNQVSIYEYTVADQNKQQTKVTSEFPGFEIGQCLKLFTSNQFGYPRLAYGGACESF